MVRANHEAQHLRKRPVMMTGLFVSIEDELRQLMTRMRMVPSMLRSASSVAALGF